MDNEQFQEELALYLLGEMDQNERGRFLAEARSNPDHLGQLHNALAAADLVDLAVSTRKSTQPGRLFEITKRLRLNRVTLAVAATVMAVLVLMPLWRHSPPAVIETVSGECLQANRNSSAPVHLQSGTDSLCTVLFPEKRNLRLLLEPESEVFFERTNNAIALRLVHGKITARTDGARREEAVYLVIDRTSFEFLGTAVVARKKPASSPRFSVIEGSVAMRPVSGTGPLRQIDSSVTGSEIEKTDGTDESDAVVIATHYSVTPNGTLPVPVRQTEGERQKLEKQLNLAASVWSLEGEKDQKRLQQPVEELLRQNGSYRIYLKNGEQIDALHVYHEGGEIVIETKEKTLRYRADRVSSVERK